MFPCASRVVAISVPHRSYGSAHSERPISVGPQVLVNIPTRTRPTEAISGNIRRLIRSRIPLPLALSPLAGDSPSSVAAEERRGTGVRFQASTGTVIRLQADGASGGEAGQALPPRPYRRKWRSMRSSKRFSAAVLAAAVVGAALAGCSSGSGAASAEAPAPAPAQSVPKSILVPVFPTTVAASNGTVTVEREPTRIVSLDPTATEDLYAIGAGTQVVAVDQNSDYPPGAPVTSLSGVTPDIGAIVGYNPSLVIAAQNSGGLVSALAKLGVPVLIEPPPPPSATSTGRSSRSARRPATTTRPLRSSRTCSR